MKFIPFTQEDGSNIYVNPAHVSCFQQMQEGGIVGLWLPGDTIGASVLTTESIGKVLEKLEAD